MKRTELGGYVGMVLLLLAYALSTADVLDRSSAAYHGMNGLGAALVAVSVYVKRAWPAFVLEACWTAIAAWGLIQVARAG
jgi:hypothetical protein